MASAPLGNHKGPARRGDHGPANPPDPLKRTHIVWRRKISIPPGNLRHCERPRRRRSEKNKEVTWGAKVDLAGNKTTSFSLCFPCPPTERLTSGREGAEIINSQSPLHTEIQAHSDSCFNRTHLICISQSLLFFHKQTLSLIPPLCPSRMPIGRLKIRPATNAGF